MMLINILMMIVWVGFVYVGDEDGKLVNSLLDIALSLSQSLQCLWVLESLEHIKHLKSTQSETMTN